MIAEKLRKSILQAAIQGKLTEQLPEDGDVRELLEAIKAEKTRLIKEGKIRKENPLPEITEDEILFDIPENWCWIRFGEIFSIGSARRVHQNDWRRSGVPFYRAREIAKLADQDFVDNDLFIDREFFEKLKKESGVPQVGDLMVTGVGTLGKTYIVKETDEFYYKDASVLCVANLGNIIPEYFKYFMETSFMADQINSNSSGTTVATLTIERYAKYLFSLPPIEEQKRIVEKLNLIFLKLRSLEKDELKLHLIQKSFPKKMKESLLQTAIQGKLTEQLETDGDARALVADIQKGKERLIKEGKIKKEKALPEITEDELPFDIPDNWCWVRLGTIMYNHGQKRPDSEFTYIDIGSIDNKANTLGSLTNILKPNEAPSRARKIVCEGDVIYATVRPYLHNTCIINRKIEPEPIVSTGFAVVCTPMPVLNKYLFRYFLSPAFDSYANDNENSKGVAYPAINDDKFSKALVPLPPLAEQQRIFERLEQLLPLCDALE